MVIPMSYHDFVDSSLSLWYVFVTAHLWCVLVFSLVQIMPNHYLSSHLCDWLPILFYFSKGFHRRDVHTPCRMSNYFHHPIAILHATSWVVVGEAPLE
jgi:hypothetical protein